MSYYIRSTPYRQMLVEATHAEALANTIEAVNEGDSFRHFRKVDASYAHAWVRRDDPHETTLYVDDGRIRKGYDPGP